ncbi:MAG: NAD(P) transhydrogenase subunit alpha [Kiritimatiellae bacterium]|nr:NAD(P) transhydrogenase subunit alpha [Kiritimatiellia bacterium]MDD5523122.1 NAD(P) transhydrogenase subunit alpha [Kiritimatiellia bacterium]
MIIGVPKEILENEKRVAALPETVAKYVKAGFDVWVESAAGEGALRSDREYEEAGAKIIQDVQELFLRSDLVLKVKQPCLNTRTGKHEVEMMREGLSLITFLHPAAPPNHPMIRMLRDRNITSFTMDGIPRTSRAQKMDALTSMSTVTGYKSVIIAAGQFPKIVPMMTTTIGTIKPANFLVIGIGVVGLQAIATAKRLGGVIKAVDIREDARQGAGSLGAKIGGFVVPDNVARGEGGYAKSLPAEWLEKERTALRPLLEEADIIILSALVPSEVAPVLITEAMFGGIKPGSVIVDVSVDQGGNCALTEPGSEIVKNGVFICGRLNIPGSMPVHASWLYANNMFCYVENLFKKGMGKPDMEDDIVQNSLVTYQGKIVHKGALKAMSGA